MTAEVIAFPVGANADDTIRATVRALLRGRGMSTEDLADCIGVSHATMYRRLGSKGSKEAFKAGELLGVDLDEKVSAVSGLNVQASAA
jgi:AcrR family transcriptional regulator